MNVSGMNVFNSKHHLHLSSLIIFLIVTLKGSGDLLLHMAAQSEWPLFPPPGLPLSGSDCSLPPLVTMERAAPSAFVFSYQVVVRALLMKMVSLMLISYSNKMKSWACFALLILFSLC